jgi:hypothetical protein
VPARLFPSTAPPIRLALGALAVYAGTRAVAYTVPGRDVQDPLIAASFGGRLLPFYVALWAVAAILCLWDMRRPTITGWGPRAVVGMMALWGTAYGAAWLVALDASGQSPHWSQTAITYLGPAVVIVALLSVLRVVLQTIAERLDGTAPDAREHHEEAD